MTRGRGRSTILRQLTGGARGIRAGWRSKARPVPYVLAAVCALAAARGRDLDPIAPSPSAAVAEVLSTRGLACVADDVTWIDPPAGVRGAIAGRSRALVRARAATDPAEPNDLYLVEARLSPEGTVLRVGDFWNLTNTSGVDESRPTLRGSMLAYTTSADGPGDGRPRARPRRTDGRVATAGFTRVQRAQAALTNLQQTGQLDGVAHTTFALDPVAAGVAIGLARRRDARGPRRRSSDRRRPGSGARPRGRGLRARRLRRTIARPGTSSPGPSTACAPCHGSATTGCNG